MPEKSGVILMARGDQLPAISRTLYQGSGDDATVVPIYDASGDTVSFYFASLTLGLAVRNWVSATIVSGSGGQVSFAWDTTATDVTPGMYEAYFRVNRVAGQTWTMPEGIPVQIWQPLVSSGYWFAPLERVRSWLDARDHVRDDVLAMVVDSVTADMEREIGWNLITRTWAHDASANPKLDGNGTTRLKLPQKYVTSLIGLTIEEEGSLVVGDRDVLRLDGPQGVVHRVDGGIFYPGIQNISCSFVAGFTTYPTAAPNFPPDLMRLGLERCGKKWQEWAMKGPNNDAVSVGDKMIQISDPDFTNEQRRILSRYARWGE